MLDRRVETILIVRGGAELLNQMRDCMGASDETRRTMSRCAITLMAVASHARRDFVEPVASDSQTHQKNPKFVAHLAHTSRLDEVGFFRFQGLF